ncbi:MULTISPECIES: aspartate kinase [Cetobacterium]|jgi:aspartate kinase|uniref:Aspartokinase n=1 Tax=Candidatus Cetobacterium colombiensis TaxID=3073100 RepID=A0ABU4WEW0_9FUSO|nr:aspartate kinase [Candidatus Cetobacterium colombiensis]MDX8336940.1 aspartate kinase [Candidatus Cetobacterium colombiensis]
MRLVIKYGGSSVATLEKIEKVAHYVKGLKEKIEDIVVVVSAMGKTTDELLKKAAYFGENLNKRELDMLISTGEQQSIALLSLALNSIGCDTVSYTGYQIDLKTEGNYGDSEILDINKDFLEKKLKENKVIIVAGFQGVNELGDITTLGRGGSDTTAVALAGVLGCECKIYTDVDGVYTEDPRKNKEAQKIGKISYDKMEEMSRNGAKVLETKAVKMGRKYRVPIYIGESLGQENGTYIVD